MRQNGQNDRELSVYYYCVCAAILTTLMEHGNLGTPSGNHPSVARSGDFTPDLVIFALVW
jgi:hypothetical protein